MPPPFAHLPDVFIVPRYHGHKVDCVPGFTEGLNSQGRAGRAHSTGSYLTRATRHRCPGTELPRGPLHPLVPEWGQRHRPLSKCFLLPRCQLPRPQKFPSSLLLDRCWLRPQPRTSHQLARGCSRRSGPTGPLPASLSSTESDSRTLKFQLCSLLHPQVLRSSSPVCPLGGRGLA